MMKLISNLPIYLRYSACLLIFVAFTACGDDEAATGETVTVETNPPAETPLAAPGSSCSCDADCASFGSNMGLCVASLCVTAADPVDTCEEDNPSLNCPTGFLCWFGLCMPDCNSYDCTGTCDDNGTCTPLLESECDSSCSSFCTE